MKKLLFLFISIFYTLSLYAGDNIFNDYLLHEENFKIKYENSNKEVNNIILNINKNLEGELKLKIDNSPQKLKFFDNNPLKNNFNTTSKVFNPSIKIKLPNKNISLSYKIQNTEFKPLFKRNEMVFTNSYGLTFRQVWDYNIASTFSYIYEKNKFKQIANSSFERKKYSLTLTKFLGRDKLNMLIEHNDVDINNNKKIYMLEDEIDNTLSISYEINLNKNFSMIMLYSVSENEKIDSKDRNNYLYTGFKYFFDLK